jgi:NTE family protein
MRALIISGGGSKGSFALGAVQYLYQMGLDFDLIAGTSTGALISPLLAAYGRDALGTLVDEYTTVRTPDIILPRDPPETVPFRSSIYRSEPLQRRIEARLTPAVFEDLRRSPTRLLLATVEMQSGELVYFQTGAPVQPRMGRTVAIQTRNQLVGATLASASIPVMLPPVTIGDRQYVDGGVREYIPIAVGIDAGAVELFCVMLSPPPARKSARPERFDRIAGVAMRSLDLLMEEAGENDLWLAELYTAGRRHQEAVYQQLLTAGVPKSVVERAFASVAVENPFAGIRAVRLHVIRPERTLEGDTLQFDPAIMRRNLEYGRERAREVMEKNRPPMT